jgi:hypothetical protein
MGRTELVKKLGLYRIQTQNEVLDFPKQAVITRDNAMISLDAVMNYKVTNPKTMIYNTQNLPMMLSKILQVRNTGSCFCTFVLGTSASFGVTSQSFHRSAGTNPKHRWHS